MKYVLIAYVATLFGCAEKMYPEKFSIFPEVDGDICYTAYIAVPRISKDSLYRKAYDWVHSSMEYQQELEYPGTGKKFKQANIKQRELEKDSVAGKISVIFQTPVYFGYSVENTLTGIYATWHVEYRLHITVDDSGYRYNISDFSGYYKYRHKQYTYTPSTQKQSIWGAFTGLLTNRTEISTQSFEIANQVKNHFVKQFGEEKVTAFFERVDLHVKRNISDLKDVMLQTGESTDRHGKRTPKTSTETHPQQLQHR